jgi:methylthioribulose-1-phosphate dehydratase
MPPMNAPFQDTLADPAFTAAAAGLARLAPELYRRGWTPATSSNFSVRLDARRCAVTVSGGDKARIAPEDLLVTNLDDRVLSAPEGARPSAEAGLHTALYRRDPAIGAVLHVHAPNAVLATRLLVDGDAVPLADLELLKAFEGVDTHATTVRVPVVDNDQNIAALAGRVDARLDESVVPAYLIAGHGAYAWGADLAAAWRHLEALDALLGLELELVRLHGGRA